MQNDYVSHYENITYPNAIDKLKNLGLLNGTDLAPDSLIIEALGNRKLTSLEFWYARYFRAKQSIENTYVTLGNWETTLMAVDIDNPDSMAAFLELAEDKFKTTVKDAKHFMELAGISANSEAGLPDIIGEIQNIITQGRECKYHMAVEEAIENEAKYEDLLRMEPMDYNLPDTWDSLGSYGSPASKHTIISAAIAASFQLYESELGDVARASIRDVAEELQAPISVILDAFYFYRTK